MCILIIFCALGPVPVPPPQKKNMKNGILDTPLFHAYSLNLWQPKFLTRVWVGPNLQKLNGQF